MAERKELSDIIYRKNILAVPIINLKPIDETLKRIQMVLRDNTESQHLETIINSAREMMCQLLEDLIKEAESGSISDERKIFPKTAENIKNHFETIHKHMEDENLKISPQIMSLSEQGIRYAESLKNSFGQLKDMKKAIRLMIASGKSLSAFTLKSDQFKPVTSY
jgi:hypothetical protein